MNKKSFIKQTGFSLIELVIVIIILGLLAVTALPRMLSVTADAEDATVEGVAGGVATGVGLVRAQWELDGRPKGTLVTVKLDTIAIGVDQTSGYPTGAGDDDDGDNADTNSGANNMTATDCEAVFNRVLQSSPQTTIDFAATDFEENDYYVTVDTGTPNTCLYYLVQTVKTQNTAPTATTVGNGFEYIPLSGQVSVFSNN
ncbi:prepilin-type N-terminal cleavage/methylation domain-containing protein [Algibacillus agarilyticus]|uniref:prepilin-type N-terminal cleavage/methylation domain-containing protein n=1 Tax=Algibacillus agarilyticus TaxID=2234133 RepID=UPI000DD06DCC|nr:prepilin-type N-terminal cleavage/methylation domain-containing protein [Algibacillus agarilyticus]